MGDESPKNAYVRPVVEAESFDGIDTPDAEDSYHRHLSSTANDRNDMDRMGKTQELRI
jgi:hypothetical protein